MRSPVRDSGLPEIVLVSDSRSVLEEGCPSAEGGRGHHVVDHVGESTGRQWTLKEEHDLIGREINGVTLETQCVWLKRRSGRYQFRRLIAGAFLEPGDHDNPIRCLGWPLGWPLITHCHVATLHQPLE